MSTEVVSVGSYWGPVRLVESLEAVWEAMLVGSLKAALSLVLAPVALVGSLKAALSLVLAPVVLVGSLKAALSLVESLVESLKATLSLVWSLKAATSSVQSLVPPSVVHLGLSVLGIDVFFDISTRLRKWASSHDDIGYNSFHK